jgi:hypothetical protein
MECEGAHRAEATLPLDEMLGGDHGTQVTVGTRGRSKGALRHVQDLLHVLLGGMPASDTVAAARRTEVRGGEDVGLRAGGDERCIEVWR